MSEALVKTRSLLSFLKETATLRQKRIAAYGDGDKLLWLADLPRDLPQTWKDACRSAFVADNPTDIPDLWLEVRKKRKPTFPLLPAELQHWVPQEFQNRPDRYVDREPEELIDFLNPQIAAPVEKHMPNTGLAHKREYTSIEKVPEVRNLKEHRQIEGAWLKYLETQWKPWAQEMRIWKRVQEIYEQVDFMRRRIEEAEERYELVLAVGLLQWRDSTGVTVKRHLLIAPAEVSLDAVRGVLTVVPAASFEGFRVELDMLELQNRPRLEGTNLGGLLEALDVSAWDRTSVAEILRLIANRASADAEVSEDACTPLERADETFRVSFAPALVLRERRATAYVEIISRFLRDSGDGSAFSTTAPWERFISEGDTSERSNNEAAGANRVLVEDGRLYFPLPTNNEQRQIAERLRSRPYVLVKGPPGTGKSHTIANLICHLLAMGERVLVTAHAPKALTVLRDLLPGDFRNLCVTAFGSSREDHRLLEDSVRGILSRKNEWKGQQWASSEIDRLQKELRELEDATAKVEQLLLVWRQAETRSYTLPGNYTGTAAQIARQIEKETEDYGWFPDLADDRNRCPLHPEDVEFLADVHATLTQERLDELRLEIGAFPLPNPDEFRAALEKLSAAESEAKTALEGLRKEQLSIFQQFSDASLDAFRTFLQLLEEEVTRASRTLGDLAGEILKDLLVGQTARWDRLEREVVDLAEKIQEACKRAGTATIDIPSDIGISKLLHDVRRRLEHLRNGGWQGWGPFAPSIVRETRYIVQCCRVNGQAPREQQLLDMLGGFLELRELVKDFCAAWPETLDLNSIDLRRTAQKVYDLAQQFRNLLALFRSSGSELMETIPIEAREILSERDGRTTWRRLVEVERIKRRPNQARALFDGWLRMIDGAATENHHPCMQELAKAIRDLDLEQWRLAWEKRNSLRMDRDRLQRYEELLGQLHIACAELALKIRSTQGAPEWAGRLRQLQPAWNWAVARAWLHRVTDPERYERLAKERHRLQHNIEKKIEELSALKAWQAFFQRIDDKTEQNLTAWTKAVARIGKGTGKYAYRHRRTARQYLMSCIPKMPAWIMPLHKLWETTDATPGVFDTVIVDEASQAGIDALLLLLLAKRIIVVGDDKQNSPEAVGVLEEDIARLARDRLAQFRFRDEFRPDTSLYDHAERAFGNLISLREHFRCVPEIIRFSNDLCYTDGPLIPLRQPPPRRLPPLKTEFVEHATCEGEGQRILNRAEAEAVVERILACLDDEAYKGKTMGVIVLQGHAQAELIERRLAEVLEPKVREERKLRCGVPSTFQGDQRDVIYLSLVAAPNHHSRALTGLPDQRRFNVAMSRARDQVWLVHSVRAYDLSRDDLRARLLRFFESPVQTALDTLYEELDRLEREVRRRPRKLGEQPDPYESWLEIDIALELLRRRYRLRPQVEVADHRIDLVVEGLVNRLAVECDGEAWHGAERFEQDMVRQRQLERAGWRFLRIRESEFYADRKRAVQRIVEACEELGIRPIGEEDPGVDDVPGFYKSATQ